MNRLGLVCLPLLLTACGSPPEPADEPAALAAGHDMADDGEMSEHCKNHAAPEPTSYARTEHAYALPEIELTDHHGAPFRVADLAASERPVVLNFVFATCTTICPVMSATFQRTREALGDDAAKLDFVSITIDPEHDTPAVLADYAAKYDATANWRFVTGEGSEVENVVRSFEAWSGSKFNHEPLTMLHRPGQSDWVRLDGLGSATELTAEIRKTLLADPIIQ